MKRMALLALSAGTGALFSALVPLAALVLLRPEQYGAFSIVYLIYAFGISLQYSVVSEAWARSGRKLDGLDDWRAYSTALSALSALVALPAAIVGLIIPGLGPSAWLLGAAILLNLVYNGVRYATVAIGDIRRVVWSDVAGVIAFVVVLVAPWGTDRILRVSLSWLALGVFGVVVLRLPRLRFGFGLIAWVKSHRRSIRPLITDSLLMDAGAIGTPFLLAGFLGVAKFGTYRAVANVAMPVRLLVEPLRPALGRMSPRELFRLRSSVLLVSAAIVFAAGSFFALTLLVPALGFEIGTLTSLIPYAAAASVFVAGNLLGSVYYISCRTHARHRDIMLGRIIQTVLVTLFPILGFVVADLGGAIWGIAISAVISAFAWAVIAYRISD